MIKTDEEALICDFAEVYNIIDFKVLSPTKAAILACGLRENSRIKMRMSGNKVPIDILMSANIIDRLSMLVWAQTKDGEKGKNRPESFVKILLDTDKTESNDYKIFKSGEAFEEERQMLLKRSNLWQI